MYLHVLTNLLVSSVFIRFWLSQAPYFYDLTNESLLGTIVAMIAVLKAGAAAVPLDANHPKSALELRVHDTRAEVVLAAPSRAHMFEDMGLTVISISREFIDSLDFTPRISENLVLPTNPCFVIFTSGRLTSHYLTFFAR